MVDLQSHFVSMSRFLLKSLLQYQSLTEGEMLPTPSSSSHPPLLPVALPTGPATAPGQSGSHSLVPLAATGEDGPLKKPKKERKERGRENGKEDSECWRSARVFIHVCEFSLVIPVSQMMECIITVLVLESLATSLTYPLRKECVENQTVTCPIALPAALVTVDE